MLSRQEIMRQIRQEEFMSKMPNEPYECNLKYNIEYLVEGIPSLTGTLDDMQYVSSKHDLEFYPIKEFQNEIKKQYSRWMINTEYFNNVSLVDIALDVVNDNLEALVVEHNKVQYNGAFR